MDTITLDRKLVESALDHLKQAQVDIYIEETQVIIDDLELELKKPVTDCDTKNNAALALIDRLTGMLDIMDNPKCLHNRGAYTASLKLGLCGLAQYFGREFTVEDDCVTNCATNTTEP